MSLFFLSFLFISSLFSEEDCHNRIKKQQNRFLKIKNAYGQYPSNLFETGCSSALRKKIIDPGLTQAENFNKNLEKLEKTQCLDTLNLLYKRYNSLSEAVFQLHLHKKSGLLGLLPEKCNDGKENIETTELRNKLILEWKEKFSEVLPQHQSIDSQPLDPSLPTPPSYSEIPKSRPESPGPKKFPENPEEIAKKAEADAWILFYQESPDIKPWQKKSAEELRANANARSALIKSWTLENQNKLKSTPTISSEKLYLSQRDRYADYLTKQFITGDLIEGQDLAVVKSHLMKGETIVESGKAVKSVSFDPNLEQELQGVSTIPLKIDDVVKLSLSKDIKNPEISPAKVERLDLLQIILEQGIKARVEKKDGPSSLLNLGQFFIEYEASLLATDKKSLSEKSFEKIKNYWNKRVKELTPHSASSFHELYKKAQEGLKQGEEKLGLIHLLADKEMNQDSLLRLALSLRNQLPLHLKDRFLLRLIPGAQGEYQLELGEYDPDLKKFKKLGENNWQDLKEEALYYPELYYLLQLRKAGKGEAFSFKDLEAVPPLKLPSSNDCVTCQAKITGAPTTPLDFAIKDLAQALDRYGQAPKKEKELPKTPLSISDIVELSTLIPKDVSLSDALSLLINFGKINNLKEAIDFVKENKDILKDLKDLKGQIPDNINIADVMNKIKKEKLHLPGPVTSAEMKQGLQHLKENPSLISQYQKQEGKPAGGGGDKSSKETKGKKGQDSPNIIEYTRPSGVTLHTSNREKIAMAQREDQIRPLGGAFSMVKSPDDLKLLVKKMADRYDRYHDNYNCDIQYDYIETDRDTIYFRDDNIYRQFSQLNNKDQKKNFLNELLLKRTESCVLHFDFSPMEQVLNDPISQSIQKVEQAQNIFGLFTGTFTRSIAPPGGPEGLPSGDKYNCQLIKGKLESFLLKIKKAKEKVKGEMIAEAIKKGNSQNLKKIFDILYALEESIIRCLEKNDPRTYDLDDRWRQVALETDYEKGPLPRAKITPQTPIPAAPKEPELTVTIIPYKGSGLLPGPERKSIDSSPTDLPRLNAPHAPREKVKEQEAIAPRAVTEGPALAPAKYILTPLQWYQLHQKIVSDKTISDSYLEKFAPKWGPGIFLFAYRYNKENPSTPLSEISGLFLKRVIELRKKDKGSSEWVSLPPWKGTPGLFSSLQQEKELPLDIALYICSMLETQPQPKRTDLEFKNKLQEIVLEKLKSKK